MKGGGSGGGSSGIVVVGMVPGNRPSQNSSVS